MARMNTLQRMAENRGFDSIAEAIVYAGKAKNASTVNSEATNKALPDDIIQFLTIYIPVCRVEAIREKSKELLGRHRVEAKNVSNGLETPANGLSVSGKTSDLGICSFCERTEYINNDNLCGDCAKNQESKSM